MLVAHLYFEFSPPGETVSELAGTERHARLRYTEPCYFGGRNVLHDESRKNLGSKCLFPVFTIEGHVVY